jgi:integrase
LFRTGLGVQQDSGVALRSHRESRQLAPGTVNLRLGAVRRLAYEAADSGLLSVDSAAGIRRIKGVKKLGVRFGNWLTAEQGHALWQAPDHQRLKGKRDRALLALLLACGLRRHEAVALRLDHLQQREEHWAIVDLVGNGGHVRTVPVPDWVRDEVNNWLVAGAIDKGKVFRRVNKVGRAWGDGITEKAVWHIVKESVETVGISNLVPHDLRRTCARLCHASGGELEQIQFLLGHVSVQTTEPIWAASNGSVRRLMIASGSSPVLRPPVDSGRFADHPFTIPLASAGRGATRQRLWKLAANRRKLLTVIVNYM